MCKTREKNELKSIVIPASYEPYLHDALKEIEYQMWLKRNQGLLNSEHPEILENVVGDIGEKSFIVANWLCTLDLKRIQLHKGIITKLTAEELQKLKSKICDLI